MRLSCHLRLQGAFENFLARKAFILVDSEGEAGRVRTTTGQALVLFLVIPFREVAEAHCLDTLFAHFSRKQVLILFG